MAFTINDRHEALRKAARFNIAWLASQAAIELERFSERVGSYQIRSSGVDQAEVHLRFDILQNRLGVFKQSEMQVFTALSSENLKVVDHLSSTLAEIEPLLANLDGRGNLSKIRALILPLEPELVHFAARAFQYGADQANADQQGLLYLHSQFSALSVGLICCGLMLIVLLVWHNALLSKAHQRLNELARNFRHASNQLNAAMDNMSQGLCLVDPQHRLIVCNRRFLALFHLTSDMASPGRPIEEILRASDRVLDDFDSDEAELRGAWSNDAGVSYLQTLKGGRTLSVSHQPTPDGGWVATYQDITERREAEARILHLAHHDVLTDLANRALFLHKLR